MASPKQVPEQPQATNPGPIKPAKPAPEIVTVNATPQMTGEQVAMFVAAIAAVVAGYWWTIIDLYAVWDKDPNYSHGLVVPFFALGLGWVAFTRHNVAPVNSDVSRRDVIVGSIEIGFGIVLHLAAMFLGKVGLLLDVVALIFILLGILMALGGQKANKAFGLPVFFLIFMAPLPIPIYQPIALAMQNFASIIAVNLFDLVGIAAFRNGYLIDIPGPHDMEVGAACSGLRSLTAILALAVAIAYLSGRGMPYRSILVAMAAPVAIGINCIRVFGTGLIMIYLNPEWATGKAHEQQGMVMVGVAAAILAFLAWLMASMEDWYLERKSAPASDAQAMQPA